jgi:hypothetical protein
VAGVERIAWQLGLNPSYPPQVATSALSGAIAFHIGNLKSNDLGATESGESNKMRPPSVVEPGTNRRERAISAITIPIRVSTAAPGILNQVPARRSGKDARLAVQVIPAK